MYVINGTLGRRTTGGGITANPIGWAPLTKAEDGSYTMQYGAMGCKDYYNELVCQHETKTHKAAYGFGTHVCFDKDGGLPLLFVGCYPSLVGHLKLINDWAVETAGEQAKLDIGPLEGDKMVVYVPNFYWTSTYFISLLLGLSRCGNLKKECPTIKEFFFDGENGQEYNWPGTFREWALKQGFVSPMPNEWVVVGPGILTWDKIKDYPRGIAYTIHMAGAASWWRATKHLQEVVEA